VYISLGGNRRGPLRVQFNLLAAMMLSGLWHGAMWTFVLWGFVHGMLQVVYRWTRALNRWAWIDKLRRNWLYRIAAIFVFYHIVTWTWVFFRAQSLEQALYMSWTMLTVDVRELFSAPGMIVVAALYCLHVLEYVIRHYERQASRIWHWVPFPLRSAAYAGLALCILYFLKGETYDFIYFQF
jgi:alginate O-acetyltransferase complex protein AlgI